MSVENQRTSNVESKTSIESYSFLQNLDLSDIDIPEGITEIKTRAFFECKNLKRLVLPKTLNCIGESAFGSCESLEEVIIPGGVNKIRYRAFADCKKLKRIIISEGVEELEWGVFSGCCNLEEVILPSSLKKIGKQLFLNCENLKHVNIPTSIVELPEETFRGCKKLDIELNPNITRLGNSVFHDCYSLSNFPSNVESFGESCFKNCTSLTSVCLNENISTLPDNAFEGCVTLANFYSRENTEINKIGKCCFKGCANLPEVPSIVLDYNESAFEGCNSITSIVILNSQIPDACFRDCKGLKLINGQERIKSMGDYAFAGCESLEEFNIHHLTSIPFMAFGNCKSLKKIKVLNKIKTIQSKAFYECSMLSEINLPDSIEVINDRAFYGCSSITSITIPANLKKFGEAAFANMYSLEHIYVSPENNTFVSPDNKVLINPDQKKLVLYASGLKDKSYTLTKYNIQIKELNREITIHIASIAEYAFAGAKHLEELILSNHTSDIEATAFYDCINLKKLTIESKKEHYSVGINIRDHGKHYSGSSKTKAFLPFEEITITGYLQSICKNAFAHFTKVKKVNLPGGESENDYGIYESAFSDCSLLQEITIPDRVSRIEKGALRPETKVTFENGLNSPGLIELVRQRYLNDYTLYVFLDGIYYIDDNKQITQFSKEKISETCTNPDYIQDNPILYFDFMKDLENHNLAIKPLLDGIIMLEVSLEGRKILFPSLKKELDFFSTVIAKSGLLEEKDDDTDKILNINGIPQFIQYVELLRKNNITDPLFYNKIIMANIDINAFEDLITNDYELFRRLIFYSGLLNEDRNKSGFDKTHGKETRFMLSYKILKENAITQFIQLVKKYNIRDRYIFDKPFIALADNKLFENLLKVYDKNIKRLLKLSEATDYNSTALQNIKDLLVLMKITGALEEDPAIRQRASTFISEKILSKDLPSKKLNTTIPNFYRIAGEDIHRVFNFPHVKEAFDQDFADFFINNYYKLITTEKRISGFIQRIYDSFDKIKETCTSNKGDQRQLKVTVEKCLNFFSADKFKNVKKGEEKLAGLVGLWFDNEGAWEKAKKVVKESEKAPRNIFTISEVKKGGSISYDMDPTHDLKEENENCSYQWLPKQDYDNLILGKYCNCCAHIEGQGSGIMRASMISDSCQNLVIRNSICDIIAKATLYINAKKGYAVYNTVEVSLAYDENAKEEIYKAFLRGSKAFLEKYNENHPSNPLDIITVGMSGNRIRSYLSNHPNIQVQKAINFGSYSFSGKGYSGDWQSEQKLVIKRKDLERKSS